ncbi:MAG: hypothetical protein U0703_19845 [Anaerolineae bacterium]
MRHSSRTNLLTILVAYMGFIGLGLNAGLLGLAWLPCKLSSTSPLDAVSILLLASTTPATWLPAFTAAQSPTGSALGAWVALAKSALMAVGLLAIALAQSWYLVIIFFLFTGLSNAFVGARLNAYLAQHHGAQAMNWLHACFGIGVTLDRYS